MIELIRLHDGVSEQFPEKQAHRIMGLRRPGYRYADPKLAPKKEEPKKVILVRLADNYEQEFEAGQAERILSLNRPGWRRKAGNATDGNANKGGNKGKKSGAGDSDKPGK